MSRAIEFKIIIHTYIYIYIERERERERERIPYGLKRINL